MRTIEALLEDQQELSSISSPYIISRSKQQSNRRLEISTGYHNFDNESSFFKYGSGSLIGVCVGASVMSVISGLFLFRLRRFRRPTKAAKNSTKGFFGIGRDKKETILRAFVQNAKQEESCMNPASMSLPMIQEDLEDADTSSSTTGEENDVQQDNKPNDIENECNRILPTSSRASRLHEYEPAYSFKVYVPGKEEEVAADEHGEGTCRLDSPGKTKDRSDDDDESEDGWSDADTLCTKDTSWFIDIELPTLLNSNNQKSISNITNEMKNNWFRKTSDKTGKGANEKIKSKRSVKTPINAKNKNQADIQGHNDKKDTSTYTNAAHNVILDIIDIDQYQIESMQNESDDDNNSTSWETVKSEKQITGAESNMATCVTCSIDDISVSINSSATIFDDETNRSYEALIRSSRTSMKTQSKKNDNNKAGCGSIRQSGMPIYELDDDDETLPDNQQSQQYYNVDNDDEKSLTTMISGVPFHTKDIESAWNEFESSQNLEEEPDIRHYGSFNNLSFRNRRMTHMEDYSWSDHSLPNPQISSMEHFSIQQDDCGYVENFRGYLTCYDPNYEIPHRPSTNQSERERLEI